MFQQLSLIGQVTVVKEVEVVTFRVGENAMIVLPNYLGKAESVGAALKEGAIVRLSGQATAAAVSKQKTPYIKMDVYHVLDLGYTDPGTVNGAADIVLVGNLGRDPELRYTSNESAVCNFSVATLKDPTIWFKVAAWGRQGENCQKYLGKGSKVLVAGRVDIPKPWQGRDGQPRVNLSVTAHNVRFLSPPKRQQEHAIEVPEGEEVPW